MLGWCAATLASIVLASVAMLPVLRTAMPEEGSLAALQRLPQTPTATATPGSAPVTPTPEATPSARPSSASPSPSRSRAAGPRTRTPTTSPTTEAPRATVEDGWTVTTDGNGTKTYVRLFRVDGGRTVIRGRDGVIELVTATPADGFSVATVQNSPDNLAVYFNEVNHSFIVHVVWQDDAPVALVDEVGS
ncbi:hypothetical protein GCM10012284_52760 [Mangrovihabitans endophyticus]|uniref:DNA mismatch repair protein MutL n=1 Tax=Mangrovihabitans endophyticus TaxID=1751298 RepID=A0A8J3FQQ8_9ACTN|nr:hypothetical protein GCM10012284_52760 [Mangrovihabitans endophyticus]